MKKTHFVLEKDNRKDKRSPPASDANVRKCMQGNKGKNTLPELVFRKILRKNGIRGYRLHWKIQGNPDIVFVRKKICIFIHGCFWHRCPLCNLSLPRKNVNYWKNKFEKNIARDFYNLKSLNTNGWKTLIVWECQLKKYPDKIADMTVNFIHLNSSNKIG